MSRQSIPPEVKTQVNQIVDDFNRKRLRNPNIYYIPRYKDRFLYLDRFKYDRSGPICRLEYAGQMDNWGLAIFKYSDARYDPEESFFSGVEQVNGTIEGAMKAGLEAYPP